MIEVNYRTVLMDRTDLRDALEQIERGLNELRDTMIEDREHYDGLLDFALDLERISAHARRVLDLTAAEIPSTALKTKTADLAAILHDIAARVEAGDSFEGSISYTCMDEDCRPDEFLIEGAYRVGNSEGQGGMHLLR